MKHFPRTLSLVGLLLLTNSCGGQAHRLGEGADGLGAGDGNTGGDSNGTGGGGGDSTDPCSALSQAVCEESDDCATAVGAQYDAAGNCFGPGTISECVEANCGDAMITWAEDPSGGLWAFSDSCVPTDWTLVSPPSDPAATSAPACGDDSDPNDPCAGVDLPACAPRCEGNIGDLAGQPCTPGDECIITTVGDECACGSDGTWGCSVHPPLGMGCNLTCDDGDGNTDADSTASDPGADGSSPSDSDPNDNGDSDPNRP